MSFESVFRTMDSYTNNKDQVQQEGDQWFTASNAHVKKQKCEVFKKEHTVVQLTFLCESVFCSF